MILLLDFEATGVDPKVVRPLEIGAAFVENSFADYTGCHRPISFLSQLIWESGYPPITEEVAKVTGLTEEHLVMHGVPPRMAFEALGKEVLGYNNSGNAHGEGTIDFVIAYNKQYDETLFRTEVARLGLNHPGINHLLSTPWLCAARDIDTNPSQMKKLMYLALDYGVTVNPKELHRAINDVELMRQMLIASGTTPAKMYAYQQVPWVVLNACVSYDRREEAKKLGYSWETLRTENGDITFPKKWVKRIKQIGLEAEKKLATFETVEL